MSYRNEILGRGAGFGSGECTQYGNFSRWAYLPSSNFCYGSGATGGGSDHGTGLGGGLLFSDCDKTGKSHLAVEI